MELEDIRRMLSETANTVFDKLCSVRGALATGAATLFAIWIWRCRRRLGELKRRGIPGPDPHFMIGNMGTMNQLGIMGALQTWREQYGDVYGFYTSRGPVLVVCDLDLLRDLMVKQFASFPNRVSNPFLDFKPWSYTLVQLQDDHWKFVRKHLSPAFSSGKLKRMSAVIERVANNFLKHLGDMSAKGEPVELKGLSTSFATDVIAGVAFGLQVDSLDDPDNVFTEHCKSLVETRRGLVGTLFTFPFMIPVLRAVGIAIPPLSTVRFFVSVVHNAVKERRQETQKYADFLQLLVEAERAGEEEDQAEVDAEIDHREQLKISKEWTRKALTLDEITGNSLLFLFAANETVSTVIAFTLFCLAANPEYLAKAHAEIDQKVGKGKIDYEAAGRLTYLEMCINETLRLYSPALQVDRQTSEDVELGGHQLPRDSRIWIPVCLIHRDPVHWPDPLTYDPDRHSPEARAARHPFAFLPFGLGPRNCIGMRLAQLEVRLALATLLQHFTPRLTDKAVYPPMLSKFRMGAEDGLWVTFHPRH